MKRSRSWWLALAVLCAATSITTPAHAGPWTLEQNHFYSQVGLSYSWASDRWDYTGKESRISIRPNSTDVTTKNSDYQQLLTDVYAEYGLLNALTLFGDFPFLNSIAQSNPGGDIKYNVSNIGDLMLGARLGILVAPVVFSVEARLTFPTGNQNAVIPTGTGDYRGELRLVAGKALKKIPLIFSGEFGFTERGNTLATNSLIPAPGKQINYSPEVYLRGEILYNLYLHRVALERLLIIASADYRASTQGQDPSQPHDFTLLPATSSMATVNGQVMWYFWKYIGVSARYSRAVYGNNIPIINTVNGALFAQY